MKMMKFISNLQHSLYGSIAWFKTYFICDTTRYTGDI